VKILLKGRIIATVVLFKDTEIYTFQERVKDDDKEMKE